jgi:Na+-transporting NADH:ubiquinone oxidoreductase subunit NqrD
MKKKSHLVYIAAAISILLPATGRFAIGIVICIAMLFITFFGTIFNRIIRNLVSKDSAVFYQFVISILLCTIFNQLLALYSPVISIYMNFTVYLAAFSSMIIGFFASEEDDKDFSDTLSHNIMNTLKFCLLTLFFFLIRDYIGYSTFTLPGQFGFIEYKMPSIHQYYKSFFWGSIPCAIVLLALGLALITFISRRFDIVRRKLY